MNELDATQREEARRLRMRLALEGLALGDIDLMLEWLDAQPVSDGTDEGPRFLVTAAGGLDRVTWHCGGAPEALLRPVTAFLGELAAPPLELDRLLRAETACAPERLGSWVSRYADGYDAGWLLQGELALADVFALVAQPPRALAAWAEQRGVRAASLVRRSASGPSFETELLVPLEAESHAGRLALAAAAFEGLDLPWLRDDQLALLGEGSPEALALVVAMVPEGVTRLGLVIEAPSAVVRLTLVHAYGGEGYERLAAVEGTLGADCAQLALAYQDDRLGVELYYDL